MAPASIEDLIAEGESDELEFKSTLRWDIKEAKANPKLEEVVAKTVAAFANSNGGSLLIGVADTGEILGLASDYASLKEGDRDKFELHLRAMLNQQFGVAFVSLRVQVRFYALGDKEVCELDVDQADKPVIVSFAGKDGQKAQRFYVRNGNASQEIPLDEMHEYCKNRFGS